MVSVKSRVMLRRFMLRSWPTISMTQETSNSLGFLNNLVKERRQIHKYSRLYKRG